MPFEFFSLLEGAFREPARYFGEKLSPPLILHDHPSHNKENEAWRKMATMNMETREVPASTEAPSGFIQKLYDLVNSEEETIGVSRTDDGRI